MVALRKRIYVTEDDFSRQNQKKSKTGYFNQRTFFYLKELPTNYGYSEVSI